jgi:NADPH-dependent curcumin reductase CurA
LRNTILRAPWQDTEQLVDGVESIAQALLTLSDGRNRGKLIS